MNKLNKLESELNISLPEIYRTFYRSCALSVPANLVGTDTWNNNRFDLNEAAAELLTEDAVNNFLEKDDFVFMMHQGYIFWYFKADGNPDPVVYSYHEGRLKPDKLERFSDFIKEYLED